MISTLGIAHDDTTGTKVNLASYLMDLQTSGYNTFFSPLLFLEHTNVHSPPDTPTLKSIPENTLMRLSIGSWGTWLLIRTVGRIFAFLKAGTSLPPGMDIQLLEFLWSWRWLYGYRLVDSHGCENMLMIVFIRWMRDDSVWTALLPNEPFNSGGLLSCGWLNRCLLSPSTIVT